jgi:N-acetylglucosaminyl-diphospho-decaprenol L-rhamnosyltransferase
MLSAITVVYNTPAELAAAIASLRAQDRPPEESIVVDTGASEGYPLNQREGLEGVQIEQPEVNVGFGGGCNLGARVASGDGLLFMNADVVLTAGALPRLTERLESDERIAVVGPLIYSGGSVQFSARAFPSLRTGVLGRRSLLTRALIRARRYPAEFRHPSEGTGPVDWVSGACMLVRRSAFDEVGGFDEGYWLYWEDADLCRRLVDAGWRVHFEPTAVVHHATGASGTSERTIRAFHESATRFANRHIARTALERALISRFLRLRGAVVIHSARSRREMREATGVEAGMR